MTTKEEAYFQEFGWKNDGSHGLQDFIDYKLGFDSAIELGETSHYKDAPYASALRKGWELGMRYLNESVDRPA